jgi:hypothetical protein
MKSDKDMFLTLKKERDGSVSFGNDNSAIIIGKGIVKIGSKDATDLLSVIQMCDQGNGLLFDSKKCYIRKAESRKLMATAVRTPKDIYVLNEIRKEICCLGKDNEIWICNRRMGHINFDNLVKVRKREVVKEIPKISKPTNILCRHCLQGKQTKTNFKSKEYSTTKPLEIIHTDLVGTTRTKGFKGEQYFMLLVDDDTRMNAIFFLKKKLEAFENFKACKEMVETKTGLKIKCLRSDNGG